MYIKKRVGSEFINRIKKIHEETEVRIGTKEG